MKSPIIGLRVASVLFGLGAVVHVIRLANHFNVAIAGHSLPLWASALGVIIAGSLSVWLWQLSRIVMR